MKAVVQDRYGSADVVRVEEVDKPSIGDGEVLVKVHAAGVDRGVWHLMTGKPYIMRVMGFGYRGPKVRVRGREVAGEVAATGKDVTRFRPGDRVFGIAEGTFAEYVAAQEGRLAAMPANLTYEQAAPVAISGLTALQAVRDAAKVKAGQKVLVIGASGGVGTYAVQIAKAFGAEVTGVCSTSAVDIVRSIGADHVVDYTREDFVEGNLRYDVILDLAGNRPLSQLRRALAPEGTLVIVGGEGGGQWFGGIGRGMIRGPFLSLFVGQSMRPFITKEASEDMVLLKGLIEEGKVRPVIERTYRLSEGVDALRRLEQGHSRGKLVVVV